MKDHQMWIFAKSDESGHFAVVYREHEDWKGYVVHNNADVTTYADSVGFGGTATLIGLASRLETLEEAKNLVDSEAEIISASAYSGS